ncbi:hypothetical protein BURMUCF1_A0666 [Burkholderia multivorans ATCC BAA-247]|nr:hypothetical protein BURMUCF1_A0666 [Burkholderia multivorans ATCC BAA-247]
MCAARGCVLCLLLRGTMRFSLAPVRLNPDCGGRPCVHRPARSPCAPPCRRGSAPVPIFNSDLSLPTHSHGGSLREPHDEVECHSISFARWRNNYAIPFVHGGGRAGTDAGPRSGRSGSNGPRRATDVRQCERASRAREGRDARRANGRRSDEGQHLELA